MASLRLCALGLILLFTLSLAACTGMGCRTDTIPVYPASEQPGQGPHQDVEK